MSNTSDSYYKTKKIVIISSIFIVLGLIIFIIIAIAMFGDNPQEDYNNNPIITNTPINTTIPPTPTIEVNNDSNVYLIKSNSNINPGYLIKINPNTPNNIDIVDNKLIFSKLLAISKDNKFIAYVNNNSNLSFYSLTNNTSIFTDIIFNDNNYYFNDNEFSILVSNKIISLEQNSNFQIIDEEAINIDDSLRIVSISPNLEYALIKDINSNPNYYVLNIASKELFNLKDYSLSSDNDFNYLNWLNNNKLIYYNSVGLFSLDTKSMIKNQIMSFNLSTIKNQRISNIKESSNGLNYYIMLSDRLFKSSKNSLLATSVYDLNNISFYNSRSFSISPNEKYIAFDRLNGYSVLINIIKATNFPLCEDNCYYPIWEN